MKKILFLSLIFFLYGCSNTESTSNEKVNETQVSTEHSSDKSSDSLETSIDSGGVGGKQSLNIGVGGFDPSRPYETAEFIKEFFYIEDEIVSDNSRDDVSETLSIGDHKKVLIDNDGYIYLVALSNLYKSEVEQVFEELNITDLSGYSDPLNADTTNIAENMTSYSRTILWDNVAVGLQLHTNIDLETGIDKPYSMIIAFDEDLINLIQEQDGYF